MLIQKNNALNCEEDELINQEPCYLNQTATQGIKSILNRYAEVIANSFEDVRQSTVTVIYIFELISNNSTHQKSRRMSPIHNEIVRKELDRMLAAGIITQLNHPGHLWLSLPPRKTCQLGYAIMLENEFIVSRIM